MSVQNISLYSRALQADNGKLSGASFLNIGKKGQIVQGQITKVGENVSLNFNGIEVSVAKNAVAGAKEGQVRNFEIREVSKDSIVLKEVDTTDSTDQIRGRVSTSVAPSDYSFAETLAASADAAQVKGEAGESISLLNGDDYQSIEDEEGSLEKATRECVERAVEKRKERKEWTSQKLEEASELRGKQQEALEKQQAAGFLYQKSEAQIRNMLQDAGIPTTAETLANVMTALGMSQSAGQMTDQAKVYVIGQNLEPTIDNLYHGAYLAGNVADISESQSDFGDYQDQIQKILEDCGRTGSQELQKAQWLFANELPINEATLDKLDTLNQIAENITPDKALEQIIFAMTAGAAPKDAVLDDREFVIAKDVLDSIDSISDAAISYAAKQAQEQQDVSGQEKDSDPSGDRKPFVINLAFLRQAQEAVQDDRKAETVVIPTQITKHMTAQEAAQVTLKRQLEEIRQKMTLQSAVAMEKRGIHIDTASLDTVIRELRDMENAYYCGQVGEDVENIDPKQLDALQESLEKTSDIARAHAALLGTEVRKQALLTVNELHAAAGSQTANRNEWNQVYETVGTQVRTDLGDSIQKAFQGIPELLREIGLEDTQANERAVRILGYNQMDITQEAVEEVKIFDAKVNRVIDNMKPVVVLELIRRGRNPLDMPLDELNQELEQIQEDSKITSEERYSRFLWKMEKGGQISEEERKGYIGVYRLLNQIQKSDGAVIGAVLGANQEVTLGNLLTQARTRKGGRIDSVIDDATAVKESSGYINSITDQLEAGFSQAQVDLSEEKTQYYQHLAEEALEEAEPSKLQEMTDGDMERLLDVSVERFYEELKQTPGNQELKKEYFEQQAKEIRDALSADSVAQEYLAKLQIPQTVENLMAVQSMLGEKLSVPKECYERKNVLPKERQQEAEEAFDGLEALDGEEEDLQAYCEKSEKIMEEILTKSYQQADINIEDLTKLRKLSRGIHLEGAMRRSHSYDIPIRTGDSVTSLNLTLIHGSKESGKIQVSMEDETFGTVSMDFKVSDHQIKGLVLCDRRSGFETLQSQKDALSSELEHAGYQIKNISYGMDFKERNELLNEAVQEPQADTGELYRIAKVLVRSVADSIKAEQGGAYED